MNRPRDTPIAPTLEVVISTDRLLDHYIRFLKKNRAVENIFFWLDVERFRRLERKDDLLFQANSIYNKYIVDGAQLEVNIDSEDKQAVGEALFHLDGCEEVNRHMFDHAQLQVLSLMKESSYPRFLRSEEGKQMMMDLNP